jgi:3-deoxy-D-manno-octulosonic-acid transferase
VINGYDIAYGLALGASAPFWLVKGAARRKVLKAVRERMGRVPARESANPAVIIHAVSLGEMNATRGLAEQLRLLRPDLQLIISTTTETGYARALELYGKGSGFRVQGSAQTPPLVIRYPLDFTGAVNRVLDGLRPSAVVLMELEMWPNFLRQCAKRGIPVVVVNGRMTEPSFRKYKLVKPVVRGMMRRLAAVCVQDQPNAERFLRLGAPEERLRITGTMKFDTATVAERVDGDAELAAAVGLKPRVEMIWVCGSTGPGEEEIVLNEYKALLKRFAHLRLVLVPRHPERFDEVAQLITRSGFPLVRRSMTKEKPAGDDCRAGVLCPVVLGDTMGELRKFYSLADVVFVGRTLVDLGPRQHGSDMIEPAALAKPVIVGPHTGNFADVMSRFRAADAVMEVHTGDQLHEAVAAFLLTPEQERAMGRAAQEVVRKGKGATERHAKIIAEQLRGLNP